MKTINININNQNVTVQEGSYLLDVAQDMDIHIPTLCHLKGYDRFTSCMICVVHEVNTDRLLPSCSTLVADGMQIETEDEKVREARKDTLDFLLSEHVGDCMAICQRACPAHMNIPLMIRQIESGLMEDAIRTVKKDIALPAVLGRICPAPCENGCNRSSYDEHVSICLLKRHAADVDLAQTTPYTPPKKPDTGKKVAIIGAGPTGLAAAYYLLQDGHVCHLYDQNSEPGGMLRYAISDEILPKSVLDAEIEPIRLLGAEFFMERVLGKDLTWDFLNDTYDAIILATGKIDPEIIDPAGIESSSRGIKINSKTYATNVSGIFAGGNAVSESQMAIRAVAHGKEMAYSVNQFLEGHTFEGLADGFQSMLGKIHEDEFSEFLKEANPNGQAIPQGGQNAGYTNEEATDESQRCFGCDCRALESCSLRVYAEVYKANQRRYTFSDRKHLQKNIRDDYVIYEPGKCIKCGLCVRITEKAGEKIGLTFVDRGFDIRVDTPFGETFSQAIEKVAEECIAACPTGALAWRDRIRVKSTPIKVEE